MNLRSEWFKHVAETHRKMKRKQKDATRRDAMKAASETWPKMKKKLEKKAKKEKKNSNVDKDSVASV